MKTFSYTIQDELGLHARPAGLLAKVAKATGSRITIQKGDKTVAADRLLSLMGLGIRHGDTILVCIEDGDEAASMATMQDFFEKNL